MSLKQTAALTSAIWLSLTIILLAGCQSTSNRQHSSQSSMNRGLETKADCPSMDRKGKAVSERSGKVVQASFEAYVRGSVDIAINKLLELGEVERPYDKAYINRMLGSFYLEKDEDSIGIAYLEKAVSADLLGGQDQLAAIELLARSYLVHQNYPDAIRQLQAQIQLSCGQSESAFSAIAYAYLSMADWDNMLTNTVSALKLSSTPENQAHIARFEELHKDAATAEMENLFNTIYPQYKRADIGFANRKNPDFVLADRMTAKLSDSEPSITVRIQPFYPLSAARDGIEGCVEFSFSVDVKGQLINIQITKSEPEGVFDYETFRAVSRWRYKPRIQSGERVQADGLTEKVCFKLSK